MSAKDAGDAVDGLSPRVRGIRQHRLQHAGHRRSIPACTGNPRRRPCRRTPTRVYPRVYGESRPERPVRHTPAGLSPRVRGIPVVAGTAFRHEGSIPACTGNPAPSRPPPSAPAVYPRVYGESASKPALTRSAAGLSPRVRGIPLPARMLRPAAGSIPACTGNPTSARPPRCRRGVYPRVYGESNARMNFPHLSKGLSPRVRGIRGHC